jgi:16S rRNA U516 pseudouridylate synthase RsuA-like enzyme
VDWQNPEQLRFVLTEGKKRQIRRMCEQVGLKVVGLKRIRIGGVVLGQLPVGQWRYLGRWPCRSTLITRPHAPTGPMCRPPARRCGFAA